MPADTPALDAERALIERDHHLGALATVLDPVRLTELVRAGWSDPDRRVGPPPSAVDVHYLRYKPGTAVVAGLRVTTPDGVRFAAARGVADEATAKLDKIRASATAAGSWAVVDENAGIGVYDAVADRYLPGLRKRSSVLAWPEATEALRYKPERRWVGRCGDDLIKVHRPAAAVRAFGAHALVAAAGLPVPRVRAKRLRHGVIVSEWVPGTPLDQHHRSADVSAAVGSLLARLHAAPAPPQLPGPTLGSDLQEHAHLLRTAVRDIAILSPGSARSARATATTVESVYRSHSPRRALVHGDFSADQTLLGADGTLVLLDLDRAGGGHAVDDLGSWIAADIASGIATGRHRPLTDALTAAEPMLAQYRADASTPSGPDAVLYAAVAGALLQLAAEPFRLRRPHWPAEIAAIVATAADLVADATAPTTRARQRVSR